MKKIIKYLDIEKQSAEFIVLNYYSLTCIIRAISLLANKTVSDNKVSLFTYLFIGLFGLLYIGEIITILQAKKETKEKFLETKILAKSKGWTKWYPIFMITIFVLDGFSGIVKVISNVAINMDTILDLINFGVALILIVGTIANRFIKNESNEENKNNSKGEEKWK